VLLEECVDARYCLVAQGLVSLARQDRQLGWHARLLESGVQLALARRHQRIVLICSTLAGTSTAGRFTFPSSISSASFGLPSPS
jgi:hypothetical protein